MFKSPILVLDTETTGFPRDAWAGVCEVGAVLLDTDGSEVDTYASLIRPPIFDARADGALAVNHIARADIEAARPPQEVAREFFAWLGNRTPYWTSFNIGFDRPMLSRSGIASERWASCVMQRACAIMGPLGLLKAASPSHPMFDPARPWLFPKLSLAAEHFGVTVEGEPHRALTDARTAARIAVAIQRGENPPPSRE